MKIKLNDFVNKILLLIILLYSSCNSEKYFVQFDNGDKEKLVLKKNNTYVYKVFEEKETFKSKGLYYLKDSLIITQKKVSFSLLADINQIISSDSLTILAEKNVSVSVSYQNNKIELNKENKEVRLSKNNTDSLLIYYKNYPFYVKIHLYKNDNLIRIHRPLMEENYGVGYLYKEYKTKLDWFPVEVLTSKKNQINDSIFCINHYTRKNGQMIKLSPFQDYSISMYDNRRLSKKHIFPKTFPAAMFNQ